MEWSQISESVHESTTKGQIAGQHFVMRLNPFRLRWTIRPQQFSRFFHFYFCFALFSTHITVPLQRISMWSSSALVPFLLFYASCFHHEIWIIFKFVLIFIRVLVKYRWHCVVSTHQPSDGALCCVLRVLVVYSCAALPENRSPRLNFFRAAQTMRKKEKTEIGERIIFSSSSFVVVLALILSY